jgi:hypothetical protein
MNSRSYAILIPSLLVLASLGAVPGTLGLTTVQSVTVATMQVVDNVASITAEDTDVVQCDELAIEAIAEWSVVDTRSSSAARRAVFSMTATSNGLPAGAATHTQLWPEAPFEKTSSEATALRLAIPKSLEPQTIIFELEIELWEGPDSIDTDQIVLPAIDCGQIVPNLPDPKIGRTECVIRLFGSVYGAQYPQVSNDNGVDWLTEGFANAVLAGGVPSMPSPSPVFIVKGLGSDFIAGDVNYELRGISGLAAAFPFTGQADVSVTELDGTQPDGTTYNGTAPSDGPAKGPPVQVAGFCEEGQVTSASAIGEYEWPGAGPNQPPFKVKILWTWSATMGFFV